MRKRWVIWAILISLLALSFAFGPEEVRSASRRVVVIDAGHGGIDPGAIGVGGIAEKTINLQIARLVEIFAIGDPEIAVVMTRREDKTVSLRDRIDLAHRVHADLYVSIHANAHRDSRSWGIETLTHETPSEPNYWSSVRLARILQRELISDLRYFGVPDRGVKRQRLYLRWAQVPAVIVETGFLTNPLGASRLQSILYQAYIARAILKGIKAYLRSQA